MERVIVNDRKRQVFFISRGGTGVTEVTLIGVRIFVEIFVW